MKTYDISDLQQKYDLDLDNIQLEIKKSKAKTVLLQFPDGLKPYAKSITSYLEKEFKNTKFAIWLGTCFGACDVPSAEEKADLVIQFGHSPWKT
jgi:2-(3-amino-3-carboxypropyl)histidine synthase